MCGDAMADPADEAGISTASEDRTAADATIVEGSGVPDEVKTEDKSAEADSDSKPNDRDPAPVPSVCRESSRVGYKGDGASAPGHDSGVEVAGGEYASSGAPDPLSRASSLISCGSGCDDSFDILSCKNADRSDEYKGGGTGDGTSEGGSESSSVTGGNSARGGAGGVRKASAGSKKRPQGGAEPGRPLRPKPAPAPRPTQGRAPALATRDRARSRDKSAVAEKPPPPGPKPVVVPRSRIRTAPDSLSLHFREPPSFKVKATKTSTARCRTPSTPPEEPRGARLPSGPSTPRGQPADSPLNNKMRISHDSKSAFDKYATLPRRKRENSPDLAQFRREIRSTSANRDTSMTRSAATLRRSVARDRESPPLRSLPPYPKHKLANRIKIYHETSMQTVLLGGDVESAFAGIGITEVRTDLVPVEKADRGVQVDNREADIERLEQRVRLLLEANANLQLHSDMQAGKLEIAEIRLQEERAEKMSAQQELQRNTERLLGLVGDAGGGGDSLVLLEAQLHTSANMVTKQQDEINKLYATCREMQRDLEFSQRAQRTLESHLRDAEREASELQDFLQAEKGTLVEALKDAETGYARAEREKARARADCRATLRLAEQRRQEALALRARIVGLTRPGAPRPNEAPALPGLALGLKTLLDTLVAEHQISPEDLEDVIFHNEAFSRSASSEGCSPGSPPPPPPPRAINTANASRLSDEENSADLLDSETEPCLMMESVLEDVQIADTYSHNLVSSGLSVVSCPANAIGHVSHQESTMIHQNDNKFLNIFNKEDSCNSLQNLTTFSGDELSPVIPDDKCLMDACYQGMDLVHLDYSENDSLHNLSQAILQRQRSEAECSMSEDYVGHRDAEDNLKSSNHYIVEQVILVDNLVNKLLKVLKIIHSRNDVPQAQTFEEKSSDEHYLVNGTTVQAKEMRIANSHHKLSGHQTPDGERRLQFISEENPCQEKCQMDDEWNLRNRSEQQLCAQQCCAEDQNIPCHSLGDCNANSPQPINSAA